VATQKEAVKRIVGSCRGYQNLLANQLKMPWYNSRRSSLWSIWSKYNSWIDE